MQLTQIAGLPTARPGFGNPRDALFFLPLYTKGRAELVLFLFGFFWLFSCPDRHDDCCCRR